LILDAQKVRRKVLNHRTMKNSFTAMEIWQIFANIRKNKKSICPRDGDFANVRKKDVACRVRREV